MLALPFIPVRQKRKLLFEGEIYLLSWSSKLWRYVQHNKDDIHMSTTTNTLLHMNRELTTNISWFHTHFSLPDHIKVG